VASLIATYPAYEDGVNQNFLAATVSVAGTLDQPQLLVVKAVGGDNGLTVATPTGGGLAYAPQADYAPASSARVAVWTAKATSTQTFSLSTTWAGTASAAHSMVVEVWEFADVAASPVLVQANGSGSPAASLTTSAPDGAVSWASGDWNAVDGAGRVYDESTETVHEEGYRRTAVSYTAYYAYQDTPTVRPHSLGLSAPTGQQYTLVGIEILDAGGAERLDPLPQALQVNPPGRISPRGRWQPLAGREDPPSRNTAPAYPASVDLVAGTGTRSFAAVATSGQSPANPGGDWLVVQVQFENDGTPGSNISVSAADLAFAVKRDTGAGTTARSRMHFFAAQDLAGGSRTVTVTPGAGAVNYRARLTVVHTSDGPAQNAGSPTAQTAMMSYTDQHSGVFMGVNDWSAGALGAPTWVPGGSTVASQQQSGVATYIFGRIDDTGTAIAAAAHGISTPSYTTPAVAALEMLGTTVGGGGATLGIAGAAASTTAATADITLVGAISGSAATTTGGTAALTRLTPITGTAATTTSATADLTRVTPIGGAAASTSSATGVLAIVVVASIAGTAASTSSATGAVALVGALNGSVVTTTAATGAVTATLALTGAAATTTAATGALTQRMAVSAAAASTTSATGDLTILGTLPIAGTAATTTAAAGAVTLRGALTGTALSTSSATGTLTLRMVISAAAASVSGATGAVGIRYVISGAAASATAAGGALSLARPIAGTALSVTAAAGELVRLSAPQFVPRPGSGFVGRVAAGTVPRPATSTVPR
jgi:hypothetical protein